MPLFALDTDTITLLRAHHQHVMARAQATPSADLGVTVISVEEQLSGWYTYLRKASGAAQVETAYRELAETVRFYAAKPILEFSAPAIARYESLLKLKINIGKYDLRIAAIALEVGAVVVTANTRDFARVPGLVIEDWTLPPGP
jgi:tRNA(fMet)-specific endonuclease VapC